MMCSHPECTGVHNRKGGRPRSEVCPRTLAAERKRSREWARNRFDTDAQFREQRRAESLRYYRKVNHQARYVYAIMVGGATLKIGCSTQHPNRQLSHARQGYRRCELGEPEAARMVWRSEGDEALEIFLQWCAGHAWAPLTSHTRHTEWFDVTGIPEDEIREKLSAWLEVSLVFESQLATEGLS